MDLIATKFYQYLNEGKIMALKCTACGAYVFPPVAHCRQCSSDGLDWTEMSGEGELLYFSSSALPAVRFADYAPYAYGLVKLKEGPVWLSMIKDVPTDPAEMAGFSGKLPLKVRAVSEKIADLNIIVFRPA